MKIGDKIKTFEIMKIVKGSSFTYTDNGSKTITITDFYFLLSDKGQERVLQSNKKSLADCVRYRGTFSKSYTFSKWNQFEIAK